MFYQLWKCKLYTLIINQRYSITRDQNIFQHIMNKYLKIYVESAVSVINDRLIEKRNLEQHYQIFKSVDLKDSLREQHNIIWNSIMTIVKSDSHKSDIKDN